MALSTTELVWMISTIASYLSGKKKVTQKRKKLV